MELPSDGNLVDAIGGLNLDMLAAAGSALENDAHDYSFSQLNFLDAVGLGPARQAAVIEPINKAIAGNDNNADEESSEDEEDIEMGMGDNEKMTHAAYRQLLKERKENGRAASSLPERHGTEWTRAMAHFGSAKRYQEAINDFALWMDGLSSNFQGVLVDKLVVDYFQWKYDNVDYLGNRCNRGTTMRSIQSMFVKYWKHVYNTDFKLAVPAISDFCSMWEKVQPPVTKTQVCYHNNVFCCTNLTCCHHYH